MEKRTMGRRQFIAAAGSTAGLAATSASAGEQTPIVLPTTSLADLHRAVGGVIASQRVGQPVFVRLTLQTAEASIDRLAELLELTRQWTGQGIERLHGVGSLTGGQVCLSVQFDQGAAALVSLAKGPSRGDGIDLLLIGNRGSVMYDSGTAPLWDGPARGSGVAIPPGLRELVDDALRKGGPK